MSGPDPLVRVAIVGCGTVGAWHAHVLSVLPRYHVAVLIDADRGRAAALADAVVGLGRERPATSSSLAEALDPTAPEFDLVAVATPSGIHVPIALEALAASKHVVVEKPVDVDLKRARDLATAAARAAARGILSSVISQHRLDPASVTVKQLIQEGRLGRLTSAVASVPWWRSDDYYAAAPWRGTWRLDGGGALMNQGVHTLDLLIQMLGEPVRVSAEWARLAHPSIEVEDTLAATLTFRSGAIATLHATTAGYPGAPTRLQVLGTGGTATIEANALRAAHVDGAEIGISADRAAHLELGNLAGHARQYLDLLDALDFKREPAVTVADALLVLETVTAIYASATLGIRVELGAVRAGVYDDLAFTLPPEAQHSDDI